MTPEQFTYWLQGFMEIENPTMLSKEKVQIIKDHLATVFNKVTPDRPTYDLINLFPPIPPLPFPPLPLGCDNPYFNQTIC